MTRESEKDRSGREIRADRWGKAAEMDWAIAERVRCLKKGESLRDLVFLAAVSESTMVDK